MRAESDRPLFAPCVDAETITARLNAEDEEAAERLKVRTSYVKEKREAEKLADKAAELQRTIKSVRGDQVKSRPRRWLWRDRIPLGGLSLLAGKGGVSKSTLLSEFTGWLTTGDMKGWFYGQPVDVGYVVNEEQLEEDVIPRMRAHGVDMRRIHFLTTETETGASTLSFPRDCDRLRDWTLHNNIRATFIDPLSANMSSKDSSDPGEMRRKYQEVARVAVDTKSTILGLAHTRKAGAAEVTEALLGSIEQVNVARSVWGLVHDPLEKGARLLSCEKLNGADVTNSPTLRFCIQSQDIICEDENGFEEAVPHPRIKWLEEVSEKASDILGDALYGTSGVDECARWLYEYLVKCGGEALFADIKRDSPKGMSERTLQRARDKMGVHYKRMPTVPPGTLWWLPS